MGDLEYYANHLRSPHWSSHKFCWLCDCSKKDPTKNPYDFATEPGWALKSFEGLKESPCTKHTLFTIPGGLPEYRVCLDVLHTLDLGVTARMAGSVLHAWAFPPGAKKQDRSKNTAEVWALLKEAYKDLGIKEKFNIWHLLWHWWLGRKPMSVRLMPTWLNAATRWQNSFIAEDDLFMKDSVKASHGPNQPTQRPRR